MEEKKIIDDELEKVSGGLSIDADGNRYFMDYGIDSDCCMWCGSCIDNCPMGCISMSNGTAVIDYNTCLRCGYCENFCPVGAIGDNVKIIV